MTPSSQKLRPGQKRIKEHDWEPWRIGYMSGLYNSAADVAYASGISISTIEKHMVAKGWADRRKELEEEARLANDKIIVKGRAQRMQEHAIRANKILDFLIGKAIVTLDKKVRNEKGELVQAAFQSESAAASILMQALREQRSIVRGDIEDGPALPSELPDDEQGLREMTAEQLDKLYAQLQKEEEVKKLERPDAKNRKGAGGPKAG